MPRPNNRFYDLLEVTPDVSPRGLKQSYRRILTRLKAKAAHDNDAADRLEDVEEAWSALSDPSKRALYHEFGEAGLVPGFDAEAARPSRAAPTWSPEESASQPEPRTFSPPANDAPPPSAFGGPADPWQAPPPQKPSPKRTPPPSQPPPPPRPDDQLRPPPADLDDAKQIPEREVPSWRARPGHSGALEIWVPFRKACLGGEGEVLVGERIVMVQIPSGTEDGQPMEVEGAHFTIRVENDPQIWRDGLDLHQSITVDRYQAKEGTEVTIRILDGYMKVTVPPGIQTGQKLRLKGRGVCIAGEEPGHMYLTVAITGTDVGRARVRKINLGSGND